MVNVRLDGVQACDLACVSFLLEGGSARGSVFALGSGEALAPHFSWAEGAGAGADAAAAIAVDETVWGKGMGPRLWVWAWVRHRSMPAGRMRWDKGTPGALVLRVQNGVSKSF